MAENEPFLAGGDEMTQHQSPRQRQSLIDILLPHVLPFTSPCPTGIARDALQYAAVEFCKKSEAWREAIQSTVICGRHEIDMQPPRGGVVLRVLKLFIDKGGWVDRMSFSHAGSTITLHFRPCGNANVTVWAAIGPTRDSGFLPHDLLEEWGDVIAAGALARLKAMRGRDVEWSDPQAVAYHQQLFDEGSARARIQVLRADRGGGSFYVRDRGDGL